MLDWVTKDHKTAAALSAADAVEAALAVGIREAAAGAASAPLPASPEPAPPIAAAGPVPPAGPETEIDEAVLAHAIETMAVQHEDTGPAEPPSEVPSLGEMPDIGEPAAEATPQPIVIAHATPAEPAEATAPVPDQVVPFRPRAPATIPAMPFNPEVPPPESAGQGGANGRARTEVALSRCRR